MKRQGKTNKMELSKEKREQMIEIIKSYFYEERDENLGDLGATLILDFILEKLAMEFYNKGIYDAYQYMNDRLDDMLGLQR